MADRFHAWHRTAITGLAAGGFAAGRMKGRLTVTLTDGLGAPVAGTAEFLFAGPGDIRGVQPDVIVGRRPAPGTVNAERTQVAHVEFSDPGLPWRYTPEANAPKLKPWLVLVVGLTGGEITVSAGQARIGRTALQAHPLDQSALWAHVHEIGGNPAIARILCPRDPPAGALTALLVPAFAADGNGPPRPAWDGSEAEVVLPCYDAWSFRTTEEDDDFLAIARRLLPLSAAEETELENAAFGLAAVAPAAGEEALSTRGALGRIAALPPDPLPDEVAERVEDLAAIAEVDGRWVLGLPRYDGPWATPDAAVPAQGWRRQLRVDPRARGAAGLGAWAAIAWQDRIAEAAARQAGALALLAERVRHLSLGLRVSRSQWQRRVPADPLAGLAVVAPMLARVPSGGATVMDALSGRTPRLVPALFSSAARRMLRPRTALARAAAPGATSLPALLDAAATRCPRPPDPLPRQKGLGEIARDPKRKAEAEERLVQGGSDLVEEIAAALPEDDVHGDVRALYGILEGSGSSLVERLDRPPVRDRCRPIADLVPVARSILDGISPMVSRPPVVARVIGDFTGVRDPELAPPDLPFELDIPLWSFLRDEAPDWLLPGAGEVPEDRLLALQTNPDFVDGLLVGANQRTLAELRWRNIPVTTGWTPLRRFWQRIEDGAGKPTPDLRPILDILTPPAPGAPIWVDASELGAPAHQTNGAGPQLVVLLRTELFRRYPATLVYLLPNPLGTDVWQDDVAALQGPAVWPNLTGALNPELVFFGFPRPPDAMASHWLVLEEPPPGFRFRVPKAADRALPGAADYAAATLYPPVRAFFGNLS